MSKMSRENSDSSQLSSNFFVIGVGASAGGLSALEEFFSTMPANTGAAFVVIQHLSPDFKSLMKELLERYTKMEVHRVTDGMKLEPNNIYLIPPRKNLVCNNLHLYLSNKQDDNTHRFNAPINIFFKSLAQDRSEHAIGVILSGTGSDGTQGIQSISEAGGIVLVQSPATAEFDGMPQSAIATGLVDQVLAPADLAQLIHERVCHMDGEFHLGHHSREHIDKAERQKILKILSKENNIDFSYCKEGTLSRRIYRRCSIGNFETLQNYIDYLQQSSEERELLRSDLLINVTNFFRDAGAWKHLETDIFPNLVANVEQGQEIRLWVTACATGEEAYSMAILLDEAIERSGKYLTVKIFATDLDNEALELASKGIYPTTIANDFSDERLRKYFIYQDGQFCIAHRLREMIIFAPHNLVKNAGFSRMHLISCRNVLIYMEPRLQQQVLRMLHFSLASKGILFLGSSETLGDLEDEFNSINEQWKIFQKRRDIKLTYALSSELRNSNVVKRSLSRDTPNTRLDPLLASAFEFFLDERQATCLLVNRDFELLHVFSDPVRLLQVPKGWSTQDITNMVIPSLQLPLRTALHRAKRENKPVTYGGISLEDQNTQRSVTLKVTFHKSDRLATDFLMVVIETESDTVDSVVPPNFQVDEKVAQRICELEYDLQQTRENLQSTIEELETTNEEQQATNEELLASNEELQSTNEELHSVNEELYTVNAEYQAKIQELSQLNNDLDNLLRNTNIGVVFLDQDLKIRKFTPAATAAIHLVESDVNRPLEHLSHKMDCPNLIELLEQSLEGKHCIEQEVHISSTQTFLLMRIYPYLNHTDNCEGLVITFININQLKTAELTLAQQKAELEYLYNNIPVGMALIDEDLGYIRANEKLSAIDGQPSDELLGKALTEVSPDLSEQLLPICRQVFETWESITNLDFQGVASPQDGPKDWLASYYPLKLGDKRYVGVIILDITETREAQRALQAGQDKLTLTLAGTGIGTWEWQIDQDKLIWGPNIHALYGLEPGELPTRYPDWLALVHPEDRDILAQRMTATLKDNMPYEVEFRIYWPNHDMRWLSGRAKVERDEQGQPLRMLGFNMDITDSRRMRETLSSTQQRLRQVIDLLPHQIYAKDQEGRFILVNEAMSRTFSVSVDRLLGQFHQDLHPNKSWVKHIAEIEQKVLESGQQLVLPEEQYVDPQEPSRVFELIQTPFTASDTEHSAVLSIAVDITERKQSEEMLRKRAFYDPLTGLPNRMLFLERLLHSSKRAERHEAPLFAVLYLDLDGFKDINDSMGHLAGDNLLVEAAQKLSHCIRPGDTVARLGGDEFAILLEQIDSEQQVLTIASRIHKEFNIPIMIDEKRAFISTSIGIAIHSSNLDNTTDSSTLLENADIAMYQAKELGVGKTQVYTSGMRSEIEAIIEVKNEFREALAQQQLCLHYQPILDLQTQQLHSIETLVRWQHPDRGLLSPGAFLTIAEQAHMIPEMERWVLETACSQFKEWQQHYSFLKSTQLTVNISAQNLSDSQFPKYVSNVLSDIELDPSCLMLELTENCLIENAGVTSSILTSLKKHGVQIALDDFGTGFSSLSHLYRFNLDTIKIDKSFVKQVNDNEQLAQIVRGMIFMAQQLNLNIIAEGIETQEQYLFLDSLKCQFGQGFLFSKPLPPAVLLHIFQAHADSKQQIPIHFPHESADQIKNNSVTHL